MTTTIYDVCGIGNAIVDIIASVEEDFIAHHNLSKGSMRLIDEGQAEQLYAFMENVKEASGGSVANTVAGIASLGGMPAYIGKLKQDALGETFRYDMRATGVHFDTPMNATGKATARCFIFVTPDAQRTMNTYIGACDEITEEDINDALIARSKLIYIEGYLWDQPNAKNAIRKALKVAKAKERDVAFTLSDLFCVERHCEEFRELITSDIDILFANEQELKALVKLEDFKQACEAIRGKCPIVVVTRSEKGSVIITNSETIIIEADPHVQVVDTTGAGDLYASGFLFGYTQGWTLKKCGELATKCATEIIRNFGARPLRPLQELV